MSLAVLLILLIYLTGGLGLAGALLLVVACNAKTQDAHDWSTLRAIYRRIHLSRGASWCEILPAVRSTPRALFFPRFREL